MTVLLFIAVLVALIVVHEFGHFIVAKRAGIRVDEFGIFFGRTLLRKRIGETDYTLNLWPIGGFVRIFGEDPGDVAESDPDRGRALFSKPKYVQAAVLVAGVTFNVLAAWLLFSGAFMIGVPANAEGKYSAYVEGSELTVARVVPDSPAAKAGLSSGDVIVGLADTTGGELTSPSPEAVASFVAARGGEELRLATLRGGEEERVSIVPERGLVESAPEQAAIGISMALVGTLELPPHLALIEGFTYTIEMLGVVTVGIVSFLADAVTLSADLSSVAGPVGIVSLVGDAAALGVVSLLTFTAFISLHLAVINLLPVPALDGGRLLFVVIEAIKGSPIRPSVANAVNAAGFALLILLMVVVTYSDIVRLIS